MTKVRCCLQVFRHRTPPESIELVALLLEYTPVKRIQPLEACAHDFFDELRDPNTRLPNGKDLPPLYNFTPTGRSLSTTSRPQVAHFTTSRQQVAHSLQLHAHRSLAPYNFTPTGRSLLTTSRPQVAHSPQLHAHDHSLYIVLYAHRSLSPFLATVTYMYVCYVLANCK